MATSAGGLTYHARLFAACEAHDIARARVRLVEVQLDVARRNGDETVVRRLRDGYRIAAADEERHATEVRIAALTWADMQAQIGAPAPPLAYSAAWHQRYGRCDGCVAACDAWAVDAHVLIYRDGTHGRALYCDACRRLARRDITGTIALLDGLPTTPARAPTPALEAVPC